MRSAYLWKKGKTSSILWFYGIVAFAGFSLVAVCSKEMFFARYFTDCSLEPCMPDWMAFILGAPWLAGGLIVGIAGANALWEKLQYLEVIPYVPPVEKQIPFMSDKEVLLRGSQAATVSPKELLRPAGRHETPAEELLRASTGIHTDWRG